jgi:outer membrane protein
MKKPFARPLLAAVLAGILAGAPVAPVSAQQNQQNPPPKPPPQTSGPTPPAQGSVPISLGVGKYDYTHGPKAFPTLLNPYRPQYVEPGELVNSPRLAQLIQDGKLNLTLQDAISLALENSMDIVVQRYNPWMAEAGVLKAKAGGFAYGTPGGVVSGSSANVPNLLYDPVFVHNFQIVDLITPVNNPFTSGVGRTATNTFLELPAHQTSWNTQYSQSFLTGTTLTSFWNNTRSSSESPSNFFNPAVQSTIGVTLTQQLLQGGGRFINKRNQLIAQNNLKIADLAFANQAIVTITATINAYWELAFARQNVDVQQQAVTVAEKLYNDNKKQLEIGTMAPLDVTRAESELSTDRQNLIVAQTTKLQDELVLKNFITKDPLASDLIRVEIIPTDKPDSPAAIQTASFEDAVKEAFEKRPDLQEQYLNLKNSQIDVRATKNALLPIATLSATYQSSSLAGDAPTTGTPTQVAGSPVVGANGVPVTVLDSNGNPVPIFVPTANVPVTGISRQGFTDAMSQVFHNRFPTYALGVNVVLPLRNRASQADSIHAQLTERQLEAQTQQLKNTALLQVRNVTIALEQGRAQVEAASKARELQQQTFDAEQKKYQLGASTVYNVILTQRDLISAQATELRALANLAEAKANYEQALGRTLEVNSVSIAGANKHQFERDTQIPGTNSSGQVVGTEELFKALEQQNGKSAQR